MEVMISSSGFMQFYFKTTLKSVKFSDTKDLERNDVMETGFFGDDEVFEEEKDSQKMIYEQHKVSKKLTLTP